MTLQPARTDVEPLPIHARSAKNGSLLTARDVADLLGVPVSWVYERSRSGRIPTVTLGRYRRYRREAIEAWVRELEREVG
jgi:excisionase family DNA binding protein